MTTENALAGGDATSAQVSESEVTSSPASDAAQTSASDTQTQEGSQTDAHGEGKSSDGKNAGESDAAKEDGQQPKKVSRYQQRINEFTSKTRDLERQLRRALEENARLKTPLADRLSDDAPEEDRIARKVQERLTKTELDRNEAQVKALKDEAHEARKSAFEAKCAEAGLPDLAAKITDERLTHITQPMAEMFVNHPLGAQLADHLYKDQVERVRIAGLPFGEQIAELADIVGTLKSKASLSARRISQAPTPSGTRLQGGANPPPFDAEKAGVGDIQALLKKSGVLQ